MTTAPGPFTASLIVPDLEATPAEESRRTRFLHAGQLVACIEPTTVTTILGSCVAVCLWDRRRSFGAMNHYVLPHWSERGERSSRFGPIAIARLLDRMQALGSARGDLEAKLFGGGCILPAPERQEQIGTQNVQVARERLREAGIPIVAEDVGGGRGRKLVFQTESGNALVRKL